MYEIESVRSKQGAQRLIVRGGAVSEDGKDPPEQHAPQVNQQLTHCRVSFREREDQDLAETLKFQPCGFDLSTWLPAGNDTFKAEDCEIERLVQLHQDVIGAKPDTRVERVRKGVA